MNAERPRGVRSRAAEEPEVWLACTACQLVYQPDPSAFESGATGCPRCGGWTWIAQLGSPDRTTPRRVTPPGSVAAPQTRRTRHAVGQAMVRADRVTTPGGGRVLSCSDPAVSPPRSPAGSGSPTTSR